MSRANQEFWAVLLLLHSVIHPSSWYLTAYCPDNVTEPPLERPAHLIVHFWWPHCRLLCLRMILLRCAPSFCLSTCSLSLWYLNFSSPDSGWLGSLLFFLIPTCVQVSAVIKQQMALHSLLWLCPRMLLFLILSCHLCIKYDLKLTWWNSLGNFIRWAYD